MTFFVPYYGKGIPTFFRPLLWQGYSDFFSFPTVARVFRLFYVVSLLRGFLLQAHYIIIHSLCKEIYQYSPGLTHRLHFNHVDSSHKYCKSNIIHITYIEIL